MDTSIDPIIGLIKQYWPAQVRIVSEGVLRNLATEENPVVVADEMASRQGDVGQRMDLAASLTILASALTIVKLALEIVKARAEAAKALSPQALKSEVVARLPDKLIVLALDEKRIEEVLARILSQHPR